MSNWDEDSPALQVNLARAMALLEESALARNTPSLDEVIPAQPTTEDQIDLVLEIAAWAHAQWVRIHPFSNGNGRTARMWANWVLRRYEMPPLASLRPRPGGAYSAASTAAMRGQIEPTILVFQEMFTEWLADR